MWYTMINNKKILFLLLGIYIILGIVGYIIFKYIFSIIAVYYEFDIIILGILYLLFGIFYIYKNKVGMKIIYYVFLLILLFFRKSEGNYNFNFYIFKWIQNMDNKIIFINVIGNILLFIPMGVINKNILYSLFIIILIEFLQLILNKGIFDIVDIFLNMIGVIFGLIGVMIWKKIKTIKKMKIKKLKKN